MYPWWAKNVHASTIRNVGGNHSQTLTLISYLFSQQNQRKALSLRVFFLVVATIVSSSISHGPSQFRTAVMSIMSGLDAEIGAAAASDSPASEILPETNIGFKVILFPSRLLQLTSFLFLSLCNLLITFFFDAAVQSKCHELRI